MTEYNNLAELRADLTADDPDERANAYGSVLQADLEVSQVLSEDPPVSALEDAGIIPVDEKDSYEPAGKYRKRTVTLLEEIRDAVKNDGGSQ